MASWVMCLVILTVMSEKPCLWNMIVLSAHRTKSLLGWGITSIESESELSMLQYNQKAAEKTDDFDVQQTTADEPKGLCYVSCC